jgi:hypothetical protein
MRIFSDVALIVNGGWWLKKKTYGRSLAAQPQDSKSFLMQRVGARSRLFRV